MKILIIANGDECSKDINVNITTFDKIICVDGGLNHLPVSLIPDVIIGDFDSVDKNKIKTFFEKSEIIYKDNQDVSDLSFAVQYCLSKYSDLSEIIITSAISSNRFDHSICNVLLLKQIPESIMAKIITKTQEIFIINEKTQWQRLKNLTVNKTISIIPLTNCKNIKTNGFKWEIENKDLQFGFINAISNIITSEIATISLEKGEILIIVEK